MSSQTPNINLTLPVGSENVSRQIINENNTKIDAAIGTLNGSVATLQSDVGSLSDRIATLETATYITIEPVGGYFTKRDAFRCTLKSGTIIANSYVSITTKVPASTIFASIGRATYGGSFIAINSTSRAVYFVNLSSAGAFSTELELPVGYYYFVGCGIF